MLGLCRGDADREYRRLFYALPPPFAAGWKPWQAHDIRQAWPLEWCDRVSTQHDNRNFTVLPQHPCAFLRNETAAAIAAGDPATAGT